MYMRSYDNILKDRLNSLPQVADCKKPSDSVIDQYRALLDDASETDNNDLQTKIYEKIALAFSPYVNRDEPEQGYRFHNVCLSAALKLCKLNLTEKVYTGLEKLASKGAEIDIEMSESNYNVKQIAAMTLFSHAYDQLDERAAIGLFNSIINYEGSEQRNYFSFQLIEDLFKDKGFMHIKDIEYRFGMLQFCIHSLNQEYAESARTQFADSLNDVLSEDDVVKKAKHLYLLGIYSEKKKEALDNLFSLEGKITKTDDKADYYDYLMTFMEYGDLSDLQISFLVRGINKLYDNNEKSSKLNNLFKKAFGRFGDLFFTEKHYRDAIKQYNKRLEIDFDDADTHNMVGACFFELRENENAIESYQKALDINNRKPKIHYNLGLAFSDNGELDKALESFKQSLECNRYDSVISFDRLSAELKKDANERIEKINQVL